MTPTPLDDRMPLLGQSQMMKALTRARVTPRAAKRPMMVALLMALAGWVALPTAAHADLRLCNKTDVTVSIAVGYKTPHDGWVSEGWWNIPDQSCNTLIPGPLGARYYYIYSRDAVTGGSWGNKFPMCTRPKEFTIHGTQDCIARGYERTGFFEVDTGQQRNWTVYLTEPTRKGANAQ